MKESSMRTLNLVLRFILELIVLVALFMWGLSVSDQVIAQLVVALAAPAIVVIIWGLFVAPRASRRLSDPRRLIVEIIIFGTGVLAFLAAGQPLLAILLASAAAISLTLMFLWGQRGY